MLVAEVIVLTHVIILHRNILALILKSSSIFVSFNYLSWSFVNYQQHQHQTSVRFREPYILVLRAYVLAPTALLSKFLWLKISTFFQICTSVAYKYWSSSRQANVCRFPVVAVAANLLSSPSAEHALHSSRVRSTSVDACHR